MRETGSKSKIRGVGLGYVIRNQISPDFRFSDVGISEFILLGGEKQFCPRTQHNDPPRVRVH